MNEEKLEGLRKKEGERGAALIMALLISALLMVASAGLILETTNNTYNVTDLTSEQQAYNAAESGIQAAVNVLRDNVTLADADRLDTTVAATAKKNRIDYLKALDLGDSNAGGDGSAVPRLSRWMSYDTTQDDRVVMGDTGNYGYKIELSDPDHTGALVTYSTTGRFFDPDVSNNALRTYGNTTNGYVIEYVPQTSIQIDTTGGAATADFGVFRMTKYGNGSQIANPNRFEIVIRMTQPYDGVRVIRGYIMSNSASAGSWSTPNIITGSRTFTLQGSKLELTSIGGNAVGTTFSAGPPPGYTTVLPLITTSGTPVDNTITGTMTSPEPIRLLIKSTGYGPKGAVKQLEAVIQKNFFNGLTAPATLTLIGPAHTDECTTCVPEVPETDLLFEPGSSTVAEYSGQDQVSQDIIPPIGTTNDTNLDAVHDSVDGQPPHPFNGDVVGVPTNISAETPYWLSSPQALDATIKSLYNVAVSAGRYFPNGVQPGSIGSLATGQGITFCDGNCEINMDGGGILVVTGKLTLQGNFSFKGLIIVTGQDGVVRSGGGTGEIQGNMVIAPYVNSTVLPASEPVGVFLAPQYDLSGGGNSEMSYNSTAMNDSLLAVDNFVLGVVEK